MKGLLVYIYIYVVKVVFEDVRSLGRAKSTAHPKKDLASLG